MNGLLVTATFFGVGLDEWALLGVVTYLLFGPRRLPELARTIGRTLAKIRRAADDFREQIERMDELPPLEPPVGGLPSAAGAPPAPEETVVPNGRSGASAAAPGMRTAPRLP
jgi:TatA/E family protein of Tat protein translocase